MNMEQIDQFLCDPFCTDFDQNERVNGADCSTFDQSAPQTMFRGNKSLTPGFQVVKKLIQANRWMLK